MGVVETRDLYLCVQILISSDQLKQGTGDHVVDRAAWGDAAGGHPAR